jgi:hypothetical protein
MVRYGPALSRDLQTGFRCGRILVGQAANQSFDV